MPLLRVSAAVAALLFALLFVGCSEDAPPIDQDAVSLQEAKDCLGLMDFKCAENALKSITHTEPHWVAEVRGGLALVAMAEWTHRTGETMVEIARLFDEVVAENAAGFHPAASALINTTIRNLIQPLQYDLEQVLLTFDEASDLGYEFEINYPQVPITIGDVPVIMLGGTMTRADFLLFGSWLNAGASILSMLLAADFDIPLGTIIRYGVDIPECRNLSTQLDSQICVAKISSFAIKNGTNVLGLEPESGLEFQADAQKHFAAFFRRSGDFLQLLGQEPSKAEDRMLRWEARPGGGGWVTFRVGEVEVEQEDIRSIFRQERPFPLPWDTEIREIRFIVDEGIAEAAPLVAANIEGTGAQYIKASDSILPMMTTAIEVVIQSNTVMQLLQIIVSAIDPQFAVAIRDIAEVVADLYSDFDSADAVHQLMAFVAPPSLAFDYSTLFEGKEHLQPLLPAAVTTGTSFEDLPEYEWMLEWECALDKVQFLFCHSDAPVSDSAHFVGTDLELGADAVASIVGYVGYDDPTLGGLLYLNPWELDPRFPDKIVAPDLQQLNMLVQDVGYVLQIRLLAE